MFSWKLEKENIFNDSLFGNGFYSAPPPMIIFRLLIRVINKERDCLKIILDARYLNPFIIGGVANPFLFHFQTFNFKTY